MPFKNEWGFPEVFIPNGIEGGNHGRNDGGYMTMFSQGPLRIGDELVFYYSSTSWGRSVQPSEMQVKGGGIFRARLRVDGFVSVSAGTLTTRVLAFKGDDLFLNSSGPVAVEAIDAEGKLLGKAEVKGNSVSHPVRFGDQSLRQLSPAGVVQLQFTVGSYGHLYSFTIR